MFSLKNKQGVSWGVSCILAFQKVNISFALVYKYTVGKTMDKQFLNLAIGPVNHEGEGFKVQFSYGNAIIPDHHFKAVYFRPYFLSSQVSVKIYHSQEFDGGKLVGDTVVLHPNHTGYESTYKQVDSAKLFDKWVTIKTNKKESMFCERRSIEATMKLVKAMGGLFRDEIADEIDWPSLAMPRKNLFTPKIMIASAPRKEDSLAEIKDEQGQFIGYIRGFRDTVKDISLIETAKMLCHAARTVENSLTTLSKAKDTEDEYLIVCAEQGLEESRNEMAEFIELLEKSIEQQQ